MVDLSPQATTLLVVSTSVLVLLLVVSFLSRPRMFTQYLYTMTGIKLSPKDVARVFKARGKPGVRELFLELIIREDVKNGPRVTPDSRPDHELLAPEERA
ncbi:MAG: hypothetical protein KA072_06300 [Thermoanaerobaculaceae bacterium]|nr:hypothetical protein [Thermoanaerobaculaceae bacterium]MDI9621999.1 hypothetical protein [Acidobacteriota bacterium]NLH10884.1 hypothetical protein [Holophagae bacterium]HPW54788.1 hypothetical protein [Thermoanaerobaculaceae bacterium]